MPKLERLKEAKNLSDLAKLLGFMPSALSYVLYKLPDVKKYSVFEISKKSGGTRTIKAPQDQLALAQSRLAELLSDCMEQLMKENPRFYAASHGFRKGRTIVSNANIHRKRRYVFNVDIADFFDSMNFGRVRGFFIKDRSFSLAPEVATVIAQIACHENALPQGSPCSPIISNLIANILDARILRLVKHARCTYTRYADDLTFSTNQQIFPIEIARNPTNANWEVGLRLTKVIEDSGFKLNSAKTRMSLRRSRQSVTGLVVNQKPNIRQYYYRTVRAMCQSVFNTGQWNRPVQNKDDTPEMLNNLRPLEGMLSHIHFVKDRRDRSHKDNKAAGFKGPKAPTELYRTFLVYKHFVANSLPIIVAEGITDITYLKCAIISRAAHFPSLAKVNGGTTTLNLSFLNPTGTSRSVLNLGQGTDGQANLIEQYTHKLKHYRHLPLANPVIILCDNDDGPKKVFKVSADKAKKPVSITSIDPFYHLEHNLYLVKVPEGVPATVRDIEDLFPTALLATLLDGKPFDKKNEHGDHTSYGKSKFAEKIVRPGTGTIDFSGFDTLLHRIASCLEDYSVKLAAKAATPAVPAIVAIAH
jgi:RNA-directed DNA polymerase